MFNFGFGGGGGPSPFGHHAHGGGSRMRQQAAEVDNEKFYNILGIDKSADESAIKKAFRRAAVQHHPDKGGDPEKFKELSKAYEVLSDPEKKSLYDQGGEEALDGSGGGGGAPMDIFDLFGMGGGGGGRGRAEKRGKEKGEDVVFPLKVTLEDLFVGTSKKLRLTKSVICSSCTGKGGSREVTCQPCRGQGVRMVIRQLGPGMVQQMQTMCPTCRGSGSSVAEKDKCKKCKGEKTTKEKKTLEVFVNKGMKQGEKIVFQGEADESPDTTPGDVIVVLQQQEHDVFRREGSNLLMKKSITLLEALTTFSFQIKHLDGRVLIVNSTKGQVIKQGQVLSIRDQGFPFVKNPFQKGHMFIEFDVIFPESNSLSDQQISQLKSILPHPVPGADYASQLADEEMAAEDELDEEGNVLPRPHVGPEDCHLEEIDPQEIKSQEDQAKREAYEEDDDEGPHRGGGQQQQCRTQ